MAAESAEPSLPSRTRWLRFSLGGLLFAVLCWAGMLAGMRMGADLPKLNPDPLQITVVQRGTQDIPGLQGLARLHIEDITDGQVVLSILDAAHQPLLAPASVRAGQVVSFKLKGRRFYVRASRLKNKLLGEDFGEFEISSSDKWSTPRGSSSAINSPLTPAAPPSLAAPGEAR